MSAQLTIGGGGSGERGRRRGGDRARRPHAHGRRGRGPGPGDDRVDHGLPRRDRRPRQPAARPRGPARRHQALRADRVGHRLGGPPGEVVQAWAYNGMVPGPRIDLDVGDEVEVEITNDLPIGTDIHWHGIDVPNDQDGVSPITQELVDQRRDATPTASPSPSRPSACTTPTPTPTRASRTACSARCTSATCRRRPAETVSGIEIPADLDDRPGPADGAQRRRRHRAQPRRQELPGDRRRSWPRPATGSASPTSTKGCRCTRCTSTASNRSWSPRTASPAASTPLRRPRESSPPAGHHRHQFDRDVARGRRSRPAGRDPRRC